MPDADLFLAPATRFGYPAVATGCFVKAFSMLVAAGVPARQGYLNPFPVLVWAWFGTLLGDEAEFQLGRRYGPSLLIFLPRRIRAARRLNQARSFIRRYDALFVLGFRFVYGIRVAAPLAIGMEGLAHRRFFSFNAFGSPAWCTLCLLSGYSPGCFAERWHTSLKSHPIVLAALALAPLLEHFAFEIVPFQKRRCRHFA